MKTYRRYKEKANDNHVPFIQPKLNIGKPGDKYEVEADAVADKVVNNTKPQGAVQKMESTEEEVQQKPLASSITPLIQQQPEAAEEENVQTKCDECSQEENVQRMEEEEEAVQTKPEGQSSASTSIESSLRSSKGSGQGLSKPVKQDMESGFGTDFSQVNIHTDKNAVQMNEQLNAQAFTHGNDIYFNEGKYNPSSSEGKHLLAHELTHTIQQKGKTDQKVQKQSAANPNRTSFGDTFTNQLQVPFYSTESRPNIRVVINHRALVDQMSHCAEFHVRIDNAQRTFTVVPTSDQQTRTVLNFRMENAVRHTLYLIMPSDCRGIRRIRASGTITRRR